MSITPLPPEPQPTDTQAQFNSKAFAWVAALPLFVRQLIELAAKVLADAQTASSQAGVATAKATAAGTSQTAAAASQAAAAASQAAAAASAATALNAPGTNATSTTSLVVGTGLKTLTVQTGKLFVAGQPVMIANTAVPAANWMAGQVTSYTSASGALSVDVKLTSGAGTLADWTVSLAGPATPEALTNAALGAAVTTGVLDWNDVSNTRPGTSPTLLMGNAANGPGPAAYFHAFNLEYLSKNGTGNVTQLAVPYGSGNNLTLYLRSRHSGVWTPWCAVGGQEAVVAVGAPTTALSTRSYVLTASTTLTLPIAPKAGDWVDVVNRSGTTTAVIARNGQLIMGLAEDMTITELHAPLRLLFVNATLGWVLK